MDAQLEQFLATETARLGIRISERQPLQERLRQYVRLALHHEGHRNLTDDEITTMHALLMMRFERGVPMEWLGVKQNRRVTRSMTRI